jgi:hypothetical protein
MHHHSMLIRRAVLVALLAAALVVGADPVGAGGLADPPNDVFADRYPIVGTSASVTSQNTNASAAPGEQSASCCAASRTVWWSWTATFTGPALFSTAGSSFDSTLGVWTGSTFGALTERGSDDDGGPGRTSWVEIGVVQGTEYHLQVGSYSADATGTIRLNVNPVSFVDAGRTHPFWRDIEWLTAEGVADGYPDGGFHPSANISRAAMSAFLYRLAGEPVVPPQPPTFTDVGTSHPFFAEIEWMNDREITTGYPDDTYRPAAPVTRGAMAAFIYRYDDPTLFDAPATPTFVDVDLTHPFYEEVEWMNAEEITTGYADDTYRPAAPVTRAAMAAFLHRYDT